MVSNCGSIWSAETERSFRANGKVLKTLSLYAYLAHSQMLLFYDQAYLDTVQKSLAGFARDRKHAEETSALNSGAEYRLLTHFRDIARKYMLCRIVGDCWDSRVS